MARSDDPGPGTMPVLDAIEIAAPGFRTAAGVQVGSRASEVIATYGAPRFLWCRGTEATPGVVEFRSLPGFAFVLTWCEVNAASDHAVGLDTLRVEAIEVFLLHP